MARKYYTKRQLIKKLWKNKRAINWFRYMGVTEAVMIGSWMTESVIALCRLYRIRVTHD